MQAEAFYEQVMIGAEYSPDLRHVHYSKLHQSVLNDYARALRFIFEDVAEAQAPDSTDTRALKEIVGHIAEWERYAIYAAADVMAGVRRPRLVSHRAGYIDRDGIARSFATIDDFNAYSSGYYAAQPWYDVQKFAVEMAETVFSLFTSPHVLTPARLEATDVIAKRLHNGQLLENIPMGWALWLFVLEHEATQHATELGINR